MNGKLLKKKENAFILQPRDMEILKTVSAFSFLNSGQVAELCGFKCRKRANDRLRKLFDNGLLSRRLLVTCSEKQLLYFAGPKAIDLIAGRTGACPDRVRKKRLKALKARDSFLLKFLTVNNFRCAFEISALKGEPVRIEEFRYKPALFLDEETKLFPDAYFRFGYDGSSHNLFLTADRAAESSKRIKKRIENYLEYGISGECEKQFGCRYFRLLIICQSAARLKSILKMIERVTDKSFCWLTVEKNISPEKILSRIWLRPNTEGSHSLIK